MVVVGIVYNLVDQIVDTWSSMAISVHPGRASITAIGDLVGIIRSSFNPADSNNVPNSDAVRSRPSELCGNFHRPNRE